jgi:hypothetical protein
MLIEQANAEEKEKDAPKKPKAAYVKDFREVVAEEEAVEQVAEVQVRCCWG